MCVCIAKPKHTYVLSKEIPTLVFEINECENEKKHCMAIHCNMFALRLIAYNSRNKTQCIQSKAIAFIAMHYA